MEWIACSKQLPANQQRVLAYVPGNTVSLPGKSGETEVREVIVLHFLLDFYPATSERAQKYGPHFWQGEGNSNHFFHDVTHWMPMPTYTGG